MSLARNSEDDMAAGMSASTGARSIYTCTVTALPQGPDQDEGPEDFGDTAARERDGLKEASEPPAVRRIPTHVTMAAPITIAMDVGTISRPSELPKVPNILAQEATKAP